jgi:uncharacterized protein YbaR (Trm112 family)
MAVSTELIEILVCPETRQPVSLATEDTLERVNEQARQGQLRNRGGDTVKGPITEALVREDARILYIVEDDIPVMLIEESIEIP